ncbi:hypothetical protein AA313_de0207013 [Arthrobotrys entomopaga]|nr:hypothetical protein AA313_de0207013 [Arthrobotrys entomopaga]
MLRSCRTPVDKFLGISAHVVGSQKFKNLSDQQAFDIHTFKTAFRDASTSALRKLQKYAETFTSESTDANAATASEAFCEFVTSLGSLEDVHVRGFEMLRNVMEGRCPANSNLQDVYTLLHVSYAVSQTEFVEPLDGSSLEFWDGVQTFRSMLPSAPRFSGSKTQHDVFDMLVDIMAEEFEFQPLAAVSRFGFEGLA